MLSGISLDGGAAAVFSARCQRFVLRVVAVRLLLHRRTWRTGGTPASRKAFSLSLALRIA